MRKLLFISFAVIAIARFASAQDATPDHTQLPTGLQVKYPKTSIENHEEGSVLVSLIVSKNGEPKDIRVSKTSGYAALDEAAKTAVMNARFSPARTKTGDPVDAKLYVPVKFSLNSAKESIQISHSEDNAVLSIKIRKIYRGLTRDLGYQLQKLPTFAPEFIVLDVRGNSGGLIYESSGLASVFMEADLKIAELKQNNSTFIIKTGKKFYQKDEIKIDFLSDVPNYLKTLPLLTLVDEKTAGSAELVVAGLQSHGRAKIAGKKTAGMTAIDSNGKDPAEWQLPNGGSLKNKGLTPDFPLENSTLESIGTNLLIPEEIRDSLLGHSH
ncbi:TonB family protein [Chitinolyticbacter meiyuanensis]|uniref:TonB family protein n=1 Tax=Chitinolyticbacter meiyuanensis TaxID=682798 RepID=UPI0011E5E811|nr:TonB family protein [Chitinolyticbacter meiyuanensis]